MGRGASEWQVEMDHPPGCCFGSCPKCACVQMCACVCVRASFCHLWIGLIWNRIGDVDRRCCHFSRAIYIWITPTETHKQTSKACRSIYIFSHASDGTSTSNGKNPEMTWQRHTCDGHFTERLLPQPRGRWQSTVGAKSVLVFEGEASHWFLQTPTSVKTKFKLGGKPLFLNGFFVLIF